MEESVKQLARSYALQGCASAGLLCAASGFLSLTSWRYVFVWPTVVGLAFSVITSIVIAMLWRWVADEHRDLLVTFYSSVSGFRMLAAILVLTGCYIAVGRDAMVPYVVIFMVFYLVGLIHHTIYFSKITNKIN